jgi:hypothetical protein
MSSSSYWVTATPPARLYRGAAIPSPAMAKETPPVTLTLEVEVPGEEGRPPRRLSLSTVLPPPAGAEDRQGEVREAMERLRDYLRTAEGVLLPPGSGTRADRTLEELLETYHPRDAKLLETLLWDGELTPGEHQLLLGALAPAEGSAPAPGPAGRGKVAASPRPPDVLVRELGLKDLKDANRARFRRLISYDEWTALKRHFEEAPPSSA